MNLLSTSYLSLILTVAVCNAAKLSPIITLSTGKVRGIILNVDGEEIVEYIGIRYGEARRFERPTFVQPWNEVYDAHLKRDSCPQLKIKDDLVARTISEDCLYLNVWHPAKNSSQLRPVMVWFHGGNYQRGTIFNVFNNGMDISKIGDVVVVTMNYRLGLFGFLYPGEMSNKTTPANLGLYDQLLALKWIQKNIHLFGGDPNQVTLFGQSAGAFSIGLMLISPLSSGLFHRAILQSGSPFSSMAIKSKHHNHQITKQIATDLGCPKEPPEELIDCLKTKSIEAIVNSTDKLNEQLEQCSPVYGDELIPSTPREALESGTFHGVDLLFGNTKEEGTFFVGQRVPALLDISLHLNKEMVEDIILDLLHPEKKAIQIMEYYTRNLDQSNQTELRIAINEAFGDYHLTCPTVLFAEAAFNRTGNKSRYYSYRLMARVHSRTIPTNGDVGHSMDPLYTFGVPLMYRQMFSASDVQLSRDMIRAWTSFARNGTTTSMGKAAWSQAFDQSTIAFMSLDPNDYRMDSKYYSERCQQLMKPILFGD